MRPIRPVISSLVLVLLSAACAPGGGESTPHVVGGQVIAPLALEDRDLQFAGHALVVLSEMRRALDDAQTLFPNTRQQARPGDLYEFGCRNLKKISPDPESIQMPSNEKFQILYNCLDGGDVFSRVDLDGAETFSVGYPEPLPRLGEPKERPLANSLVVNGKTTYVGLFRDGLYGAGDEVRVLRKTALGAQVTSQNETDLVFEVDFTIEDTYRFEVSRSLREGVFVTKISGTAVVDKKSRKVRSLVPGAMTVTAEGTQWEKETVDKWSARSKPRGFGLGDYSIEFQGAVRLPADACELPEANLVIKKGSVDEPVEVMVASRAGKIGIEATGAESELKACDLTRAADPVYARVLEGLYF